MWRLLISICSVVQRVKQVLPKYANSLTNCMQQVIHSIGKIKAVSYITPNSTVNFSRIFIIWVNKFDPKTEGRKLTSIKGMIKVPGLSQNRAKQIYPRLAWLLFQYIYLIYLYINNNEASNYAILITSMSDLK